MEPRKQANGRWRVRYRDGGGKSREKWFDTKAEGTDFIARMRIARNEGTFVDPRSGEVTVRVWAEEFLRLCRRLSASTQATYRRDLEKYIIPEFGAHAIKAVPGDAVENWLLDELDAGIAASSVHRHYRTFRRMLQVAVEKKKLAFNPLDAVDAPHVPAREMAFLNWDQVIDVAEAHPAWLRPLIYTTVDTGMRWSEITGMQRKRVDLKARKLRVVDQLVYVAGVGHVRTEPKNKKPRSITISRFTADLLAEHFENGRAGSGPDGLLFPNTRGNPFSSASFHTNYWKPALVAAGAQCRFHDLRHTSASLAILAGAHPKAIQTRLGHASIAITLDRYGHLFPELDEAIADAFTQSFADAQTRFAARDGRVIHAAFG